MSPLPCPHCDGPAFVLGILGHTAHFRCRNCGWTFEAENEDEEDDELEDIID